MGKYQEQLDGSADSLYYSLKHVRDGYHHLDVWFVNGSRFPYLLQTLYDIHRKGRQALLFMGFYLAVELKEILTFRLERFVESECVILLFHLILRETTTN